MKLLADENVHFAVVARLRAAGFDVEAVAEISPGLSDEAILARVDIASLVFITYDRDFGDLIFNHKHAAPDILIYSRLGRADPFHVADRIAEILESDPKSGFCYVITRDGVRPRPFASGNKIDG